MSNDALQQLRDALEHHIGVYGRYELLPPNPPETAGALAAELTAEPTVTRERPAPLAESVADRERPTPPVTQPAPAVFPARLPTDPYARIAAAIKPDSPLVGMTTLAEVEAYVRETVLIPLDETRLNPVFGVGNPDADLLVIGEAPGADEDRMGEPFVGRAGQLLTEILKAIGFERSDVYIANILKSRPPGNRDPEPEEIAAHLPILLKQISIIRPKVMLCVGRTAGNSLLGRQSTLADLRGHFHDFHGLPVLVTFHPAALLRNSSWKRPTWEDVQLLRRRYDELVTPAAP